MKVRTPGSYDLTPEKENSNPIDRNKSSTPAQNNVLDGTRKNQITNSTESPSAFELNRLKRKSKQAMNSGLRSSSSGTLGVGTENTPAAKLKPQFGVTKQGAGRLSFKPTEKFIK